MTILSKGTVVFLIESSSDVAIHFDTMLCKCIRPIISSIQSQYSVVNWGLIMFGKGLAHQRTTKSVVFTSDFHRFVAALDSSLFSGLRDCSRFRASEACLGLDAAYKMLEAVDFDNGHLIFVTASVPSDVAEFEEMLCRPDSNNVFLTSLISTKNINELSFVFCFDY